MSECIVCGMNLDPDIALLNTGTTDCCDICALERRDKYYKQKYTKTKEENQWLRMALDRLLNWCEAEITITEEQRKSAGNLHRRNLFTGAIGVHKKYRAHIRQFQALSSEPKEENT